MEGLSWHSPAVTMVSCGIPAQCLLPILLSGMVAAQSALFERNSNFTESLLQTTFLSHRKTGDLVTCAAACNQHKLAGNTCNGFK